ncbi:MAG: MucBP domain-containing protein [Christensenellales bacterium]
MNKHHTHHPISRLAALMTALLLCLAPLTALGSMPPPVNFTLAYTDAQGQAQQLQATPIAYDGYATSFWLFLDPQAQADPNARLLIQDNFSQYPGGFSLASDTPLSQLFFMDAGSELSTTPLEVLALGTNGETLATYFLYISLSAQQPNPPAVAGPAMVTIHYVDQNQQEFASEQREFPAGFHSVTPDPARVPADYILAGQGEYQVEVNEFGANPADVTFIYQKQIAPAMVTIHYVDQNQQEFASEQREYPAGFHTVTPDPVRVPADYTLAGQSEYQVEVNEFGANPADIIFTYQKQIGPAMVTIRYVNQNQQEFASEQREYPAGFHTVTPDPAKVPADYALTGQGEYQVEVNEFGANPADITFTYQKQIGPAMVTIRYVDQNQQEFASEQRQFAAGFYTVTPDPARAPTDYALAGQGEYQVEVNELGANPADLTFTYQKQIAPATVTIHYVDQNQQEFASEQREYPAGFYTVTPDPARVPTDYVLTGQGEYQVEVNELGANPADITFVYQKPVQPATLTIYFKNNNGQDVASRQEQTLVPGNHTIEPWPVDLQPDYVLTGDTHFMVTVDERGAVPSEVTFVYELKQAVSENAEIKIYYTDQNGVPVAAEETRSLIEGLNQVEPRPLDLKEGYTLSDEAIKAVHVSNNQAEPASLTFVYSLTTPEPTATPTPTPPPAPKVALVPVKYMTEAGALLHSETVPAKEGEQTFIAADLTRVDTAKYELTGVQQQTVTVDAQGIATPNEVVFTFRDISIKVASLKVHFRDETGNALADSQTMELKPGVHPVTAPQSIGGMQLQGESTVNVTVSDTGVLSQAEVVFVYAKPATPTPVPTATPEPTTIPFDITPVDQYAYPNNDKINYRNTPEVKDGNVIGTVGRKDLAHLIGSLKNRAGENWYLADINGQQGFLKANVVTVLSFNEAAAILGFSPSPSPSPTPTAPAIPDGAVIDRWGEVTSTGGVNFRSSTSTATSSRIGTLDRGERFWVYEQQTVDGEAWYNIMAGGKTGFVMAKYTRLYTQEESDKYQSTLASPMPHSVTATPVPATATPAATTAAPTSSPSPPPQLTASPTPYHGYALTTSQVPLRSGVSQKDEVVLATLPVNTLVYIWNQTYVGNVGWNSVDALALTRSGYLPDSVLRRITDQEAAPYLEQLKPQATASPAPTIPPQQVTGYAITLGDHVMMRAYADTNAQILDVLQNSAVVSVRGQEFTAGETWHLVQYGAGYGFVRADQLRLLSAAETAAYLESLRTPTPTPPAATLAPVTLDSPSSYGYVTTNNVRLRKGPSTSTSSLKMMQKNAFALVYGSRQEADGLWYHINQGGTEGYVMSSYFKVLPMGQLSSYLQSPEYLSANTTTITSPNVQPGTITSVEDFNTTVWQNPALLNPSYEPFNPLGTPTPAVEAIPSPSPSASSAASPAPSMEPLPTFQVLETEAPQKSDSSFPVGWVAVGLIAVLGGGGYYAYHLYNQNQKRAAQRAAQRRQQAARQAGSPQARPALPQQGRSPYQPPTGQNTAAYRPGMTPPPAQGSTPQGTAAYRPPTSPHGQPPTGQGTASYRPPTPSQGQPPTGQSTTAYRPGMMPPPTQGSAPQGTASYRPPTTSQGQPPTAQPDAGQQSRPQQSAGQQQPDDTRRRRSDRHSNT